MARTTESSFYLNVDKTPGRGPGGDCWIWTAGVNNKGYGIASWQGKAKTAHALSFFFATGHFATGVTRHLCHFRICVNPKHLKQGTPKENMQDSIAAGRLRRGENHPSSRLTEIEVKEIRELRALGITQSEIASMFGIGKSTVGSIEKRDVWKHVS